MSNSTPQTSPGDSPAPTPIPTETNLERLTSLNETLTDLKTRLEENYKLTYIRNNTGEQADSGLEIEQEIASLLYALQEIKKYPNPNMWENNGINNIQIVNSALLTNGGFEFMPNTLGLVYTPAEGTNLATLDFHRGVFESLFRESFITSADFKNLSVREYSNYRVIAIRLLSPEAHSEMYESMARNSGSDTIKNYKKVLSLYSRWSSGHMHEGFWSEYRYHNNPLRYFSDRSSGKIK